MNSSQFYLFFTFLLISATRVGAQYWQQFVDYKIDVDLNPETAIYSGTQTVEYKNNSPETLKKVFFHHMSVEFRQSLRKYAQRVPTTPEYSSQSPICYF